MNVFKRIHDIVSSNVNSMLDKMEDPKKMIDLMITELEDTEMKIKVSIAEKRAELSTLKRESKNAKDAVTRWAERAVLAVERENDELAREAIVEKKRAEDKSSLTEESIKTIESITASLEEQLSEVSAKLSEMKAKRNDLVSRASAAKERINASKKVEEADNVRYMKRFEELQAKIEKWEAEAELFSAKGKTTKKETFEEMELSKAVEEELSSLKAKRDEKEGE